jgi:hypothetical protein
MVAPAAGVYLPSSPKFASDEDRGFSHQDSIAQPGQQCRESVVETRQQSNVGQLDP